VPIKLAVIRETWGVSIDQPEPTLLVMKRSCAGGGFWSAISGKKSGGFEVTIRLPPSGRMVGELTVTGRLFGTPDRDFAQKANDLIPKLIADVQRELKNVEDRRKYPRVAAGFAVTFYPIHSDGGIDVPIYARCRDVSIGGLCAATDAPLPTKYFYATFDAVGITAGQAILVRTMRVQTANRECLIGGHYRADL
jgi:hypothetical protein